MKMLGREEQGIVGIGEAAWRQRAACADVDTRIFFDDDPASTKSARACCSTCPVQPLCLEFAMANRIPAGMFGGLTSRQRRSLRARRRAAVRQAEALAGAARE